MTTDPMCAQVRRGGPWHVLPGDSTAVPTMCLLGQAPYYTTARASGIHRDEPRCRQHACHTAWMLADAGRR